MCVPIDCRVWLHHVHHALLMCTCSRIQSVIEHESDPEILRAVQLSQRRKVFHRTLTISAFESGSLTLHAPPVFLDVSQTDDSLLKLHASQGLHLTATANYQHAGMCTCLLCSFRWSFFQCVSASGFVQRSWASIPKRCTHPLPQHRHRPVPTTAPRNAASRRMHSPRAESSIVYTHIDFILLRFIRIQSGSLLPSRRASRLQQ